MQLINSICMVHDDKCSKAADSKGHMRGLGMFSLYSSIQLARGIRLTK